MSLFYFTKILYKVKEFDTGYSLYDTVLLYIPFYSGLLY